MVQNSSSPKCTHGKKCGNTCIADSFTCKHKLKVDISTVIEKIYSKGNRLKSRKQEFDKAYSQFLQDIPDNVSQEESLLSIVEFGILSTKSERDKGTSLPIDAEELIAMHNIKNTLSRAYISSTTKQISPNEVNQSLQEFTASRRTVEVKNSEVELLWSILPDKERKYLGSAGSPEYWGNWSDSLDTSAIPDSHVKQKFSPNPEIRGENLAENLYATRR